MSSSGIKAINSGPLIIRTYNQSYNTLSTTNTYLLGQYETPIPSNYILITTLNGQLAPTNNPTVSSFNVSTLNINNGFFSTLTGSTINNKAINTSSIIGSTLQLFSFANFKYDISTLSLSNPTTNIDNGDFFGKYIFTTPTASDKSISLQVTQPSGAFMVFKNIGSNSFTIGVVDTVTYTIQPRSTIHILCFNNLWYSIGS